MSLVIYLASSKRGPGSWRYDSALLDNYRCSALDNWRNRAKEKKDAYAGQGCTGVLLDRLFGNILGICICKSAQIVKEEVRLRTI